MPSNTQILVNNTAVNIRHCIPCIPENRNAHFCFNGLFQWFVLLSGKVICQMKCLALCPSVQYRRNHISCTSLAHSRFCLVKQKNMDLLSVVSRYLVKVLRDQKSTAMGIWLPAQTWLKSLKIWVWLADLVIAPKKNPPHVLPKQLSHWILVVDFWVFEQHVLICGENIVHLLCWRHKIG